MIKRIKTILGKKRYTKLKLITVLMLVGALIDTALTYVVLPFVTIITDMDNYMDNSYVIFLSKFRKFESVSEVIALFSILIALAYVLRNVYMLVLNKIRFRFLAESKAYVASSLFSATAKQPYSYFSSTNTSAIQSTCINDISRLFGTIDSILSIIINVLTLIFISAVLLASDVVLTILAIVVLGIMTFLVNRPIAKKARELSGVYTLHYTSMLKWTQQFVGSLKTVLTERKQKYFVDKFTYHSAEFTRNEGQFSFCSSISGYVTNATTMGLVFGYIAILALRGEDVYLKIPTLALFAIGAMKLMPCVSNFAVHLNNIKYTEQGVLAIYNQLQVLCAGDSICDINEEAIPENKALNEGIVVGHVFFGFEDTEEQLFKDVSLKIPANTSVAFIGSTGSGKTTLADIILGLQKPGKGTVLVDGHDIFKEKDWWASHIGYIPQIIYLCEESIRSNVAFGVDEKNIDDSKVVECLKKAQMWEFVRDLPQGMDTITGENGVKLSGGQRQRIGIARALYHNPSFLVFDEATSALDVDTEAAIMETVNSLAEDRTILIIAHRLSTIEKCDIVYKIEHGSVERVE